MSKITRNQARVASGGKKIVQQVTYSGVKQQTKVTIERNANGGNPRVTGIDKKKI